MSARGTRDRVRRACRSGSCAAGAAANRALPFQPIERIAGGMGLRDRRAGRVLSPIVVVALRAGQVELALPALENLSAGSGERRRVCESSGDAIGMPAR